MCNKIITMHTAINRRQLMQQLALLTVGAAVLPNISFAQNITNDRTVYVPDGAGKKASVSTTDIVFKLAKNQTDMHLGVWESVLLPGTLGAPPHIHNTYDEICRVLEGSIHIMVGDTVTEVKAGGWHLRPKGIVHTFWNSGTIPAKTIDMSVPGGHEDYMMDLSALFDNHKSPKPEDFKNLAAKHDIIYRWDLLKGIMEQYKVHL